MGRNTRTKIDFARTITWYDFALNKLIKSKGIKSEYAFAKHIYTGTEKAPTTNLFKKYKFGLSSPGDEWISIMEEKVKGSRSIFTHDIWQHLNINMQNKDLIIKGIFSLPSKLRDVLVVDEVYDLLPLKPSDIEYISDISSIDTLNTLFLLYTWGKLHHNIALMRICIKCTLSSLEKILHNNPCLTRSHIILFDIIFEKMLEPHPHEEYINLTSFEKVNWRDYRDKYWGEELKISSELQQNILRETPPLANLINETFNLNYLLLKNISGNSSQLSKHPFLK